MKQPSPARAWLSLLLLATSAGAAEHTDLLPTTDTAQVLRARSQPETALDRWHDRFFFGVQDFITRLDSRFVGDDEAPLPVPASPFRIGIESDAIHHAEGSLQARPRVDIDVLLQLPNLERRLQLFVTSDTVSESPRLHSASSAIRAGLRLTPLHYLDFDVGIRADVPPVAFASLRWQREVPLAGWQLLPLAKLYIETGEGVGFAAGASFDRWWDRWVFRASSYGNWRHRTMDTEFTQSFTIAHAAETLRQGRYGDVVGGRDLARGYGLQLLATGTRDTGAQRYEASFFVKRPTATRWLYWHVAPLITWEKPLGWHPDPGIRIGIDALFWDVSGR